VKPANLKTLLNRAPFLEGYLQTHVLDALPWIFNGDSAAFSAWRTTAATSANVQADSIFLVGSGATGYSLSPIKATRPFRTLASATPPSDLDIAIVDPSLFLEAWEAIVRLDRSRSLGRHLPLASPGRSTQEQLAKLRQDVYYGTISGSSTPPGTTSSQRLRALFAATSRQASLNGYPPRARIYRRLEDLKAYHIQSLNSLHRVL
jgi:hypothetical protein